MTASGVATMATTPGMRPSSTALRKARSTEAASSRVIAWRSAAGAGAAAKANSKVVAALPQSLIAVEHIMSTACRECTGRYNDLTVRPRMATRTAPPVAGTPRDMAPIARATLVSLTLFCLAHFFVDMYSGALGALQPLLLDQFHLNFTEAGILAGVLSFSSSVLQPGWGYLADRFHSRLFTALAPAVAGIFISSLGLAPSYSGLVLMVFLGGAGIASFHPHAASNAVHGIIRHRARAMAIFICSGTFGLALGPTYFSAAAARLGLPRTYWAALPGVA